MRSKENLTLIRKIDLYDGKMDLLRRKTFLLDDGLLFVDDNDGKWLKVLSVGDGEMRQVYACKKPEKLFPTCTNIVDIAVVKDCLVVRNESNISLAV